MWYIHTMEHYSAVRKDEVLPFAVLQWMDLEDTMLSEMSEKIKNRKISPLCRTENRRTTNEWTNKQNKTQDSDNSVVVTRGKGQFEGKEQRAEGVNPWWREEAWLGVVSTMQYALDVLWSCTLKIYKILLMSPRPHKFKKKKKRHSLPFVPQLVNLPEFTHCDQFAT